MRNESGNVLFLILIGVALFGALQFAMSRGSQVNMTGDKERNSLAADQILRYGLQLSDAVQMIRNNGYGEGVISFEHAKLTGYTNADATDQTKIFSPNGGGAAYQAPKSSWLAAASQWYIFGGTCIPQIGDYDDDCVNNGRPELIVFLPNVTRDICAAVNQKSGIAGIPRDVNSAWTASTPYTGSFASAERIYDGSANSFSGKKQGCFDGGTLPAQGTYTVYQVLLAR